MLVGRSLQQIPTDPSQLAAYIFNLLSSGNTQSAATAIAQAATQGSSGANAIATAIATASSTVRVCVRACCFSALSEPGNALPGSATCCDGVHYQSSLAAAVSQVVAQSQRSLFASCLLVTRARGSRMV